MGRILRTFGFNIQQTCGSHDEGVDFRGVWNLHSTRRRNQDPSSVLVIGQCKHEKKKSGTAPLRELEATLARRREEARAPVLAVMVCSAGYSPFALRQWANSPHPILLAELAAGELDGDGDGDGGTDDWDYDGDDS